MSLTRRKRRWLFGVLAMVLWLAVVAYVLAEPLFLGPTAIQDGAWGPQNHYFTMGNIPLYSWDPSSVGRAPFRRFHPHHGLLFAAVVIIASGLGLCAAMRWGLNLRLVGRCDECGYDLQGIKSPQCPECGTEKI